MRPMLSLVSPLAAAVLCAATRPAVAQQAAQQTAPRAAVDLARPGAVAAGAAAGPRTVAAYWFSAAREAGMPAQVTVTDSAGVLAASFRLQGERASRPMLVEVVAADLMLQGETPAGVLTLLLYGQNDPGTAGTISGRWWRGEQQGDLRGRLTR